MLKLVDTHGLHKINSSQFISFTNTVATVIQVSPVIQCIVIPLLSVNMVSQFYRAMKSDLAIRNVWAHNPVIIYMYLSCNRIMHDPAHTYMYMQVAISVVCMG